MFSLGMAQELGYSDLVSLYESIAATPKRLEKETLVADFLRRLHSGGKSEWIYLLKGKVFPDYDSREFGISTQLTTKALCSAYGVSEETILQQYTKIGDLGEIAEELSSGKKQRALFSSRLTLEKVFTHLRKLVTFTGKGTVDKKVQLIVQLLGNAIGVEAKYLVRTLLGELRVGIADGIIRDAIAQAFFAEDIQKEITLNVGAAYDLLNDFAVVFEASAKGKAALAKISLSPGRPLNVMLAVKVSDLEEAFSVCGKPAALEYKYDGFRVVVHKTGKEITLFTRRLENVTTQFPDVVRAVREHVKGDTFILDAEVVGYDPVSRKYKPFEAISQRIKRKYDIATLETKLPVEVNIFDVLFYNGVNCMPQPYVQRRALVEKIISPQKYTLVPAMQIVTDDLTEAQKFYEKAVEVGEEGVMVKRLDAPYQAGRKVGYMVKLKPILQDLDLVIIGAEYGSGKRGGWLTSYILGCARDGTYLEVGRVSSGLKEKSESEDSTTFEEMSALLKPLITSEDGSFVHVKPQLVVSVTYQNIQKSPSYSSGYALRFPRIARYRPDKGVQDIASLKDIEREFIRMQREA